MACQTKSANHRRYGRPAAVSLGMLAIAFGNLVAVPASAFPIDTGDSDIQVRLDNTVKYSTVIRTGDQDAAFLGNGFNFDDGQRAFPTGHFASQRFDLLNELDVTYGNVGFSGSAASWYDAVYNVANHDGSQASFNGFGPSTEFPQATRNIEGRDIELVNAYFHGQFNVAGLPLTLRAGRYAQIWGESLFSTNSIAYGMAPTDLIKAIGVPGSQIKEITLPVAQVGYSLQFAPGWSFEGYTQVEWRATRFPAADSYYEFADFLGDGGNRILAGANPFDPAEPLGFYHGKDRNGRTFGQFGFALKWNPTDNLGFQLVGLRFDDKTPQIYTTVPTTGGVPDAFLPGNIAQTAATGKLGTYFEGYARNIELYGLSATTTYGSVNYGFEASARRNQDLEALSNNLVAGSDANFDNRPLYPVGDTLHYLANAIYVGSKSSYWDGVSVTAEVSGSHLLEITANKDNFNPSFRHNELEFTGIVDPAYYQVVPNLDVDFPVTLGWNFQGNGPWADGNNTGAFYGGELALGVNGTYRNVWRAGLTYTRYFGNAAFTSRGTQETPFLGRDFVSFNVQRTF